MTRRRLDVELVRRGLAASRSEARDAIDAGRVLVGGRPAPKAATLVAPDDALALEGRARPYASRGGEKLAGAIDALGIDPRGRSCLDAGASAGGFTDVLLERGAARVVAVDVGYGQLDWRLRTDPRVTVLDRTNARDLRAEDLPFRPDLVTADLSFISLTKVASSLTAVAAEDADLVLLVKPQFEVGRGEVGSGGVVRDPDGWRGAIVGVAEAFREAGAGALAVVPSSVPGPAGNVEFFLHARRGDEGRELALEDVLERGRALGGLAS